MTTNASPTGGCKGGKSLGCSHTCVSGPTFPSVISAQKGHTVVPSRRFMRCGALTRYCLKIGFQIKGVVSCIYFLAQHSQRYKLMERDGLPVSQTRSPQGPSYHTLSP